MPQGRAILGDGARLLAALHLGDEWRVQRVGDLERSCLAPVIAMRKPRLRKRRELAPPKGRVESGPWIPKGCLQLEFSGPGKGESRVVTWPPLVMGPQAKPLSSLSLFSYL